MTHIETNFIEALRNVFLGSEFEGDSGFVNMLEIKSRYFVQFYPALLEKIKSISANEDTTQKEIFDQILQFLKQYISESGSVYFHSPQTKSPFYEEINPLNSPVSLNWNTKMLYYIKSERLWTSIAFPTSDINNKPIHIFFDVSGIALKQSNEKRVISYSFSNCHEDKITLACNYSIIRDKSELNLIIKDCTKAGMEISKTNLTKAIRSFERRREIDFYLNKDAKTYLKRQLDGWVKNKLLSGESQFDQNRIGQAKKIKESIEIVIDYISMFEDMLVKLWLKPKFVLDSNYVITTNRILELPDGQSLIDMIISSPTFNLQVDEWKQLDLIASNVKLEQIVKAFSSGSDQSLQLQFLPFDTKILGQDVRTQLEEMFTDMDNQIDGWLIRSENFQALNTLLPKFKGKIQTIYIDPPFNLGENADFQFNVNYKDATWIALLENRIDLAHKILSDNGNMFVRCDYNGNMYVRMLMDEIFGKGCFKNELVINRINKQDSRAQKFNMATDSLFFYAKSENSFFKPLKVSLKTPKGKRWHGMDSQGQGSPSKIFGHPFEPPKGRHWTFSEEKIQELENLKRIKIRCKACGYEHSKGVWKGCQKCDNKDEIRAYYLLDPTDTKQLDSNWTDIPGYTSTHKFSAENSEILLKRVIECSSMPNDLVMDFFLGSGTTIAVAHKLGRKWIGIEMDDQFETVVLPRMKRVLAYQDKGISKLPDVKDNYNKNSAGGCFKYYGLEQYEQTLSNVSDSNSNSAKDAKETKGSKTNVGLFKIVYDFDSGKINSQVDFMETLSMIRGKLIRKKKDSKITFADGTTADLNTGLKDISHFSILLKTKENP